MKGTGRLMMESYSHDEKEHEQAQGAQRWGPGTGSEVNNGDQVAKPKLALWRAEMTTGQILCFSHAQRAGPACQNLGRERRGIKHLND